MSFFTPRFIFLVTFFLCGALSGAFTGSLVPEFSVSEGLLVESGNIYIMSFVNAFKYSIFPLIFSRFLGFLIPVVCFLRSFFLTFSLTAIYSNIENFFDSEIIIKSFAENIVAVPIFLLISSISLDLYLNRLCLKKRKAKIKARLENKYSIIVFCLIINVVWNIFINILF